MAREIQFQIEPEDALEVFVKQGRRCALSGVPLMFARKGQTASLDRIDSKLGYTKDNLQWVHKHINVAKNSLSVSDFVTMCREVVTPADAIQSLR